MSQIWRDRHGQLATLAERQLFFIGGAPRSGTTWLQQMLNAHPAVTCRGEGLFLHELAVPLEALMARRAKVVGGKNRTLFAHTGGFPQFDQADAEHLIGTAILLAMDRYEISPDCRAIGEKTPENIFFFPRLQALFPQACFIAIARDPRDVLSSAWHFFGKPHGQAIQAFVEGALPSMQAGMRALLEFRRANADACRLVTYESLRADPVPALSGLFTMLGVGVDETIMSEIVAATEFSGVTGGRPSGVTKEGSFHRRGVVGDWRETMPETCNQIVLRALGWVFPHFGWAA